MPEESQRRTRRHAEIADDLRQQIRSGVLKSGDRVPSENDLMRDYDVARSTARQALAALRDEGLTETRQGAPTRVRAVQLIRRSAPARLAADVWGSGRSMWDLDVRDRPMDAADVQVGETTAPEHIAAVLDLADGATVVRRSRRYLVDGRPVMRAVSWIPGDLAVGTPIAETDTGAGGTYARLGDVGHGPASFREESRTAMPTPGEAEALDLTPGTPVVHLVRTAWDAAGRPVEVNEMLLNGSAFVLEYRFPA